MDANEFHEGMNTLRGKFIASLEQKQKFIQYRKEKIKERLDVLPSNSYRLRYNHLLQEQEKNSREKVEYEIRKQLENKIWFSYLPQAYDEIHKHLAGLISKYEKLLPAENKDVKIREHVIRPGLTLLQVFKSNSEYDTIMNLLVSKGFCQPNTFIWKDEKKGNKGYLAALLKYLHAQGYYKDNKRLTIEQIQEIAKNTFGWELAIDTIKRASPENFDLSFIPSAKSTL